MRNQTGVIKLKAAALPESRQRSRLNIESFIYVLF